ADSSESKQSEFATISFSSTISSRHPHSISFDQLVDRILRLMFLSLSNFRVSFTDFLLGIDFPRRTSSSLERPDNILDCSTLCTDAYSPYSSCLNSSYSPDTVVGRNSSPSFSPSTAPILL